MIYTKMWTGLSDLEPCEEEATDSCNTSFMNIHEQQTMTLTIKCYESMRQYQQ